MDSQLIKDIEIFYSLFSNDLGICFLEDYRVN